MKKYFLFLLISVISLCSCTKEKKLYNVNYISYKDNINISRGIFAAQYKGNVYFFSNDTEVLGVYSMDNSGNDIKLLFECQDIAGLQVKDDMIFALVLQDEQFRGRKVFDIEVYSISGQRIGQLLDNTIYQYTKSVGFSGVSGFYIDENGNSFINIIGYEDARNIITNKMFYQKNGKIDSIHRVSLNIASDSEDINREPFGIYQIGDNYITITNDKINVEQFNSDSEYRIIAQDAYGYNCKENCAWWNYDELGNKWEGNGKIWGFIEKKMVLSKDNELMAYNTDNRQIESRVKFPLESKIAYVDINEGYMNVIVEEDTPSVYKKGDDNSEQTLYNVPINMEFPQLIKKYEKGDKIIYVNDEVIINYNGQVLNFSIIADCDINNIGSELLEVPEDVSTYQTDIAGNWIFIKIYNEKVQSPSTVIKIKIPDLLVGIYE